MLKAFGLIAVFLLYCIFEIAKSIIHNPIYLIFFLFAIVGFVFSHKRNKKINSNNFEDKNEIKNVSQSNDEAVNGKLIEKPVKIQNFDELIQAYEADLNRFLLTINESKNEDYIEVKSIIFIKNVFEGTSNYPNSKMFKDWIIRSDLPEDIQKFGYFVFAKIKEKKCKIDEELENKLKKDIEAVNFIINRNQCQIEDFIRSNYTKFTFKDEFVFKNNEDFTNELVKFLNKIGANEELIRVEMKYRKKSKISILENCEYLPITSELIKQLEIKLIDFCNSQNTNGLDNEFTQISKMSGIHFEQFLSRLLKKLGAIDLITTKISGDQGGDIIFTYSGLKIVVQAKRYNSIVGNGAIQEVYAAKGFYKCDKAWVITNSNYTKAARELAAQLNVDLFNGYDLVQFESIFENYFKSSKTNIAA